MSAVKVHSDLDLGGSARVINAQDPAADQDVATKIYVDTAVAGAGGVSIGKIVALNQNLGRF